MIFTNKETGEFDVTCTKCGEVESFDTGGVFADLLKELKANNWKTYKEGEDWCHSCPACFEEWKAEKYGKKESEKKDPRQGEFDFMKSPMKKKSEGDVPF